MIRCRNDRNQTIYERTNVRWQCIQYKMAIWNATPGTDLLVNHDFFSGCGIKKTIGELYASNTLYSIRTTALKAQNRWLCSIIVVNGCKSPISDKTIYLTENHWPHNWIEVRKCFILGLNVLKPDDHANGSRFVVICCALVPIDFTLIRQDYSMEYIPFPSAFEATLMSMVNVSYKDAGDSQCQTFLIDPT